MSSAMLNRDDPGHFGKQRIVRADPDILTGLETSTTLADQNTAGRYGLPCSSLHAQSLALAIPAIPGASHSFFYVPLLLQKTGVGVWGLGFERHVP